MVATDARIAAARGAMQTGRHDEALRAAKAVLADREDIDAREIVALVAMARGQTEAAATELRQILAVAPEARWARDDLVRLLIEAGRPADAEAEARAAVIADPGHADAHALLGGLFSMREALPEGAWHLRGAIALAGRHPQLLADLARNLMRQGLLDEAAALADEAARAAPADLATIALVAEIAERAGRLDEATRMLDRAELIARAAGSDVLLARATLLSRGEGWREALALLDAIPAMSGAGHLVRGRLRDRAGRHPDAWADFTRGKAMLARDAGRHYDPAFVEAHFATLADAVTPAQWQALPRAGTRPDVPQPLFILGMPRSGTTMLEQMLASHPEIRPGGELPFGAELADFASRMLGSDGLAGLATADRHHLPALFRDFYLARAESLGLTRSGARFFTDKMPINEIHLPLLRIAFPEAPMVSVTRHPLDVLVSIMSHDMTHGFDCGYRIEDAAHQLAAVSRLTRTYREHLGIAPHVFGYEAFIADQRGETERLMAHIGLPPHPAQFRFHENRRVAATPSYAQVQEPLHDRSIGRWRNYATELAGIRTSLGSG